MTIYENGHELVERHLMKQLREVAEYSRVIFVNGARQAGKTTLLEQLHAALGGSFRSLDVERERAAARADPDDYLAALPRPVFIDEVQRCAARARTRSPARRRPAPEHSWRPSWSTNS